MAGLFGVVPGITRDMLAEYAKRSSNHDEMMNGLKSVNRIIQSASNLRGQCRHPQPHAVCSCPLTMAVPCRALRPHCSRQVQNTGRVGVPPGDPVQQYRRSGANYRNRLMMPSSALAPANRLPAVRRKQHCDQPANTALQQQMKAAEAAAAAAAAPLGCGRAHLVTASCLHVGVVVASACATTLALAAPAAADTVAVLLQFVLHVLATHEVA